MKTILMSLILSRDDKDLMAMMVKPKEGPQHQIASGKISGGSRDVPPKAKHEFEGKGFVKKSRPDEIA